MKLHPFKITLISLVLGTGAALAHSGASGVVKQRMEMMGDIAAQMKSIAKTMTGENDFVAADIAISAKRIAGHADSFEAMFPNGTNKTPSEARSEIWIKWNEFLSLSNSMKTGAMELASAAKSAEGPLDIRKPFGKLGTTCKSCHQEFRQKK